MQVGSLTGQVVEMGLHTTQLLNPEKYPIVVPNSFFSNQVVVPSDPWHVSFFRIVMEPISLNDYQSGFKWDLGSS